MVETTPQPHQPLSAKEFRDEVNRRGWTYRALAERWNTTESYVSRVAGDENRRQWFDDAIRGLPFRVVESAGADPTRKNIAVDSSTLGELLKANKIVEVDGGTLLSLFKASGAVIATEPRTRTAKPRQPKPPVTTTKSAPQTKARVVKAPKPKNS